ncbi:MAG: DmsE family decaheme c-type cytochrome [Acidobacteria bacterium]|nr:DmsE family decaheme c-type cytochrome [Acidobacteriota bacterium]
MLSTGSAAGAAQASQAQDESQYVGSEACKTCHEPSFQSWKDTAMGKAFLDHPQSPLERRGCESCHGPGRAHVEGGGGSATIIGFGKTSGQPAQELNARCLQCHEKGMRLFWKGSTHESRGLTCVTCHQVMQPNVPPLRFAEPLTGNRQFVKQTQMEVCFQCHKLRRAQVQRSSHMPFREGKITCSNCHNPHGTPNPALLKESTVNENCYQCHAERRGPFLWEHPPVMENCTNCHEAHGSSRPQLLKASMPRLCNQCHNESRHPTTPQLATTRFAFNRGCTNCHSMIHGSNHPSGVRFQR